MNPLLMSSTQTALLLVDYQSRLMPVIHDGAQVLAQARRLAQIAQLLAVPVVGTEQNPERLGPNLDEVRALCRLTLPKMHFGACPDGLLPALHELVPDLREVVVAGCEAHVCLLQTALGLIEAGLAVRVVADACGSRRLESHALALQRLQQAGATIVNVEMVAFEWLHSCRHERFKEALALIK